MSPVPSHPVLMVSRLFPPLFGGAPVQAVRLAKALSALGVQTQFLTDAFELRSSEAEFEGLHVSRRRSLFRSRGSKLGELLFALRTLAFVVTHPRWKILHFHSACGFEILLFPIYKLLGRKILLKLTLAGNDDPLTYKNRRLLGKAYFWGLLFVDKMAAISQKLRHMAIEASIPQDRVHLIPNGVDEATFAMPTPVERKRLRHSLNLQDEDLVFLSVGKLEHRKGYDTLLKAFKQLLNKHPNARLLVVGPGNDDHNPFYQSLLNETDPHTSSRVRYEGLQTNIAQYMQAADVFVFCSREEGFGTVLIEAMSCGLPTVATEIEGITADILQDPRISRICPTRSPQSLQESIQSLLGEINPVELADAARQVMKQYSIKGTATTYIALYNALAGQAAAHATAPAETTSQDSGRTR